MTKTIKAILIAVASVLVISLCAGLIVHFTKGKTDKPEAEKPAEEYELSGKVYDDGGNVMLSQMVYAMPTAMTISEVQTETISRTTISATVSPENATDDTVEGLLSLTTGLIQTAIYR